MILRWAPLLSAIFFCSCTSLPPPATVDRVDLRRYPGDWYEIEAFPAWFQRGCAASRANYQPMSDGRIRVVNSCIRKGRPDSIEGTARVIPGSDNAKLKVRFFGPFEGDYWILDLDPSYRWVAVGHPNRKYLWILSRTKDLDPATLSGIRARLAAQGYDVSKLRKTPPASPDA